MSRIQTSLKCFALRPFNYFIPIPRLNKQSSSTEWRTRFLFRSICGGRCLDQTRHILVWKSTSPRMLRATRGLSHRSIRSTSSRVEQWSWSSWLGARECWSPFASCRRSPGTWWSLQTARCWRTGPYGYQHRTSWWSCTWSRGFQRIPYPGERAGTWPLDSGISHCQWWWPARQVTRSSSPGLSSMQQSASPARSPERRSKASPWCLARSHARPRWWRSTTWIH